MSLEQPDHKDILDRLHLHDLRLTRVEVQQQSMAHEIAEQTTKLEKLADKLEKLSEKISDLAALAAALDGRQKLILTVILAGIPLIVGLEIWNAIKG